MKSLVRLLPGGGRIAVLALPVVVAAGAAGAAYVYSSAANASSAPPAAAVAPLALPPPAGLLVDVIGAVNHPGLYRMQRGDRVYDAIAAAGGLAEDADPQRLPDLAGRLKDGEQIKVPFLKSTPGSVVITRTNLNSATLEELEVVPGFTQALAEEVVDYRTNFGGFQNTRELVEILGMSEASYTVARRYLTL